MKVFISYGDATDQVTALRLQALGAANGLTVYVPPAYTRRAVAVDDDALGQLHAAEVVLGIVGGGLSKACLQELTLGRSLGKNMIVMAYPSGAAQLLHSFGPNVFVINPEYPYQSEHDIVQYLKDLQAQASAKKALLALGTLALGLLMLAPSEPD